MVHKNPGKGFSSIRSIRPKVYGAVCTFIIYFYENYHNCMFVVVHYWLFFNLPKYKTIVGPKKHQNVYFSLSYSCTEFNHSQSITAKQLALIFDE